MLEKGELYVEKRQSYYEGLSDSKDWFELCTESYQLEEGLLWW